MPTLLQIEDFRKKARAKGFTEMQIQQEIARKIKADAATTISDTNTQTPAAPAAKPEKGFFAKVGETLVRPMGDYLKYLGETGYQITRAGKYGASNKASKQMDDLIKQNQDVLSQLKITTDPAEKKRLLDQSRALTDQIDKLGQTGAEVGALKPTKFLTEKQVDGQGQIVKTGLKATAGGMSYFVPGGSTLKGAIAGGAAAGALLGVNEGEDITLKNVLGGAIGGAASGAAVYGLGKVLSKARQGFKALGDKATKNLSDEAAARINKATPTQWANAVEDHGMNLNDLTAKYFPKGGTYDDLLGGINERGRGGVFRKAIDQAEAQIQKEFSAQGAGTKIPVDDLVTALTREKNQLAKLPGNEANSAALEAFIQSFATKYKNGITPTALLELKRVADSKFGQAVVNEATGSATAQAQKMIANAGRAKLKELFPTVADALQTEAEVYTLQPIMNRARAILNTGGSTIRIGSLKGGITDLLNPFNLMDAYLGDPKRASAFLKTAAPAVQEAVKANPGLLKQLFSLQFLGRTASRVAGATVGEQVANGDQTAQQQGNAINPNQNITDINQLPSDLSNTSTRDTSTISQPVNPEKDNIFGMSREEFIRGAFLSGMNTDQLTELGKVYDMMVPKIDKKGTSGDQSQAALNTLLELKDTFSTIQKEGLTAQNGGLISRAIGGLRGNYAALMQGNKSEAMAAIYKDNVDAFISLIVRGLGEKGVLTDQDVARVKKAIPKFSDSPEKAAASWAQIERILQKAAGTESQMTGADTLQ